MGFLSELLDSLFEGWSREDREDYENFEEDFWKQIEEQKDPEEATDTSK
jgi:hypothetical protein